MLVPANVTVFREVARLKALTPMVVTPAGMVIATSEVAP
ncbi:unannotated protein [freshwater metagenome]|uniref:Unannotated protein n=1 Tax=freshwater metagenome TaxID=449393 RepID=A0A6J7TSR8_9ZZZZ